MKTGEDAMTIEEGSLDITEEASQRLATGHQGACLQSRHSGAACGTRTVCQNSQNPDSEVALG